MDQLFSPPDEPRRTRTGVPESDAPLPVRMRPRTVDEVVGQQHLLGPGQPLRRADRTQLDLRPDGGGVHGRHRRAELSRFACGHDV